MTRRGEFLSKLHNIFPINVGPVIIIAVACRLNGCRSRKNPMFQCVAVLFTIYTTQRHTSGRKANVSICRHYDRFKENYNNIDYKSGALLDSDINLFQTNQNLALGKSDNLEIVVMNANCLGK